MRVLTWAVLVTASIISVMHGRLGVALAVGTFKAITLGLEFMELRAAARVHAVAWGAFCLVLAVALAAMS